MDNGIKALTVTQISTYFKQIFDAEEMLFNVCVIGEISGLSLVRGVAYFTLKDENAMMSCVCFDASNFSYNNGDKVLLTGTPRYYIKGGKLNFNVSKIEKYGQGELYQKFLELLGELEKKGYFDSAIKKQMPKDIKRIGVVTSKEGAVIQDIINVRTRRNPQIDIVLFPVKVQGVNAEYEIANGIETLDNYDVDLIIVARGGGSFEDLAPFNTRVVADAVHNAKKFIVSAVGHETDFSICDYCSDMRAPTPSAAAELVCDDFQLKAKNLFELIARLKKSINAIYLDKHQEYFSLVNELINNYSTKSVDYEKKIVALCSKLKFLIMQKVLMAENNLEVINSKLLKMNPSDVLRLGYATLFKNNEVISNISKLKIGDEVVVKMRDGEIDAKINNIREKK